MKKKAMSLFAVLMLSFTFASVVGAYQDNTPGNNDGAPINTNPCVISGLCQRP